MNAIAKKKDDIGKHLEAGNEVNAKIWVSYIKESDVDTFKESLSYLSFLLLCRLRH